MEIYDLNTRLVGDNDYVAVDNGTDTGKALFKNAVNSTLQEPLDKLDGIEEGAQVNKTYTPFTGKPTANQNPQYGYTFTVSQISQDATGQVTGVDRTVKIPKVMATDAVDGLMAKEDKAKLDGIETEANKTIVDATLSSTSENPVQNKAVTNEIDGLSSDVSELQSDVSDLKSEFIDKASAIINTASGTIAHFEDGADGLPVKDLKIQIEPVQEGSGDPSPDNVRPITGHTQAVVTRTGKNLFDDRNLSAGLPKTAIGSDINAITASTRYAYFGFPPPQTTLIKSASATNATLFNALLFFGYKDGKLIEYKNFGTNNTNVIDGTQYDYIRLAVGTASVQEVVPLSLEEVGYVQVELGSTATDYEPYQGETYDITFPDEAGTVYGGTLDVTSGVLTVERAMFTLSSDTTFTSTQAIGNYTRCIIAYNSASIPTPKKGAGLFSHGIWKENYTSDDAHYYNSGTQFVIFVPGTTATEAENYIAAQQNAGTPLQITYDIATPITYQLTAQQIDTLLGTNNIWADTGDTEIQYRADTKLYIDSLTAPDDDMIADANIASGKYFIVNNKLYLATAAIATGASIIPGTNCTETNLAEALNTINA